MKVIIDSNILISDIRLNSPDSKTLLEASKLKKVTLSIPQIVLDEVINHVEERLKLVKSKVEKERKTLTQFVGKAPEFNFSVEKSLNEYKELIEQKIKENNIDIIPYPKTDHKIIANKAIKKIRPFITADKGYRDALIWENVKSKLPASGTNFSNPDVIFISGNTHDFFENGEIHPHLIAEIEQEGLEVDSIKVLISLSEFTNQIAKFFFEQANSFKTRLENGEIEDFDFEDYVLENLRSKYHDSEISNIEGIPIEYQNPTIRFIEGIENIQISEVRKLNAMDYKIDFTCDAEITMDFFVDKYDYFSDENSSYGIVESDYNDYVVLANETMNLTLKISMVIDKDDYLLVSMELK